jgi:hypothetical protein
MIQPEDMVRRHARQRLAEVFRVPENSLTDQARFGYELTAAPPADFRLNEFDAIDADIKDVADRQILKEMAKGSLVIRTVGDYCAHMVRCSHVNPKEVARILRLTTEV